MQSEVEYEPAPVTPSDWREYTSSHPALHPQPPERDTRPYQYTSLDPKALIDEAYRVGSFNHRRTSASKPVPAVDLADVSSLSVRAQRLRNRPLSHVFRVQTLGEASNSRERFNRVRRIDNCGIDDVLFSSESGPRVYRSHCRCRACPRCDTARRKKLQAQFDRRISMMKRPKFLTLTLRQTDEPLAFSVHRIKEAFRRMRSNRAWKVLVRGGFWVLEIKRNNTAGLWNVHIHAIIDAAYVPQEWLSTTWQRYTGDSYIVDIRRATPSKTRYMTKYVTKGDDLDVEGELLWNFYESQHRMRDCSTFGNQFGLEVDAQSESSSLLYCGVVSDIIRRARLGEPTAQGLVDEVLMALSAVDLEPPDENAPR